jgi:antitoxin component of MazEF toxin-antitoxin module
MPYVRNDYTVQTMKKKLTRTGNSVALVLEKPLLEQLGLDENSEVEISTNGDVLVMTPLRENGRRRKLQKILKELDEQYAGVFRRLAE